MTEPIEILVIYVCRRQPAKEFLLSYHTFHAGIEHEMRIVIKGAFCSPWGYDLHAYREVAQQSLRKYVCCLNCHSVILATDWLRKLAQPFMGPDGDKVGIVGTTASCESMLTNAERAGKRLNWLRRQFFPPFPNPHIRTTGFIMRRALMLDLWPRWFPTKRHCYLHESGWNGLTRKLWARGLQCLVMGKDGVPHQLSWNTTETFRVGDQQNLLIADKQTCRYRDGTTKERTTLEKAAWGI